MNGTAHTFDSFECAIHALAPTCRHCGMRIIGHGLENNGVFTVAIIAPERTVSPVFAIASSGRARFIDRSRAR